MSIGAKPMHGALKRFGGCALGAAAALLSTQLLSAPAAAAKTAPATTGVHGRPGADGGAGAGAHNRPDAAGRQRDSDTGDRRAGHGDGLPGAEHGDHGSGAPAGHPRRPKLTRQERLHRQAGPPPAAPTTTTGSCVAGRVVPPAVVIPVDERVGYRLDGAHVAPGTYPTAAGEHVVRAVGGQDRRLRATFTLTTVARECDAPDAPGTGHGRDVGSQGDQDGQGDHDSQGDRDNQGGTTGHGDPAQAGDTVSDTTGDTRSAAPVHRSGTRSAERPAAPFAGVRTARVAVRPGSGAPCTVNCAGPVVPVAASFADDTCVASTGQRSGATYTIPSTRGVLYWVNGTNVAPGTYPARDGSTVTVVTSARAGYTLSGITQWTHTFSEAPTCSGVGVVPRTTSPGTGDTDRVGGATRQQTQHTAPDAARLPASTGAPVRGLLTGALLLLLLGAVTCLAGTYRRPQPAGAPAARLTDGSPTDPAAGSGRTPPRPDPAVGPPDQSPPRRRVPRLHRSRGG